MRPSTLVKEIERQYLCKYSEICGVTMQSPGCLFRQIIEGKCAMKQVIMKVNGMLAFF